MHRHPAASKRIKILNQCIADTVFVKIYLLAFLEFGTHVTVQCRKPKNHIAFLQQIHILLYGFAVGAHRLRQLVIRNLAAHLQRQGH